MSANPQIRAIPPQRRDSLHHLQRYLSGMAPYIPENAQEGNDQFEHELVYGVEEVGSYWQGDGSSSVPDRHAVQMQGAAATGGVFHPDRVPAQGYQYGYPEQGQFGEEEEEDEWGRRQLRPASTPPEHQHIQRGRDASFGQLGRYDTAPLREHSVTSAYRHSRPRREGLEARAARTARAKEPRDAETDMDSETAHRLMARKLRRRELKAIRQPPPLLELSSPPRQMRRRVAQTVSDIQSDEQSASASDRVTRPAKRARGPTHKGEEMMRKFRSAHVTKGRLTLRPEQVKGKGFLGKTKSSGAILGRRADDYEQQGKTPGSSESAWSQQWKIQAPAGQEPTAVEVTHSARRPAPAHSQSAKGEKGHKAPEVNRQRTTERELEIVRNSKIPLPGRTGSPSWPSGDSHSASAPRLSQIASPRHHTEKENPQQVHPRHAAQMSMSTSQKPPAVRSTLPLTEHMPSNSATGTRHRPFSYVKAAAVPSATAQTWQPRPASGFGTWAAQSHVALSGRPAAAGPTTDELANGFNMQLRLSSSDNPVLRPATQTFGSMASTSMVPVAPNASTIPPSTTRQLIHLDANFGATNPPPTPATRPLVHFSPPTNAPSPYRTGTFNEYDIMNIGPGSYRDLGNNEAPPWPHKAAQDIESMPNSTIQANIELGVASPFLPLARSDHSSFSNASLAQRASLPVPLGSTALKFSAPSFQLDAGDHNPFTDSQNPFVAPNTGSSGSRPSHRPLWRATAGHLLEFPGQTEVFAAPARPLDTPVHDKSTFEPQFTFKKRFTQDPDASSYRPQFGSANAPHAYGTLRLPNPARPPQAFTPFTLPPVTPQNKQIEDELGAFWSQRPAFR